MKKNVTLVLTMLLVVSLAIVGCPTPAEEIPTEVPTPAKVYEWKFYSFYGPEEGACCFEWPILFDEIERATNGQLKITAYWMGEHPYEGADALKVIKERSAELAHFYGGYLSATNPAFNIDGVPMILPSGSAEAFEVIKGLYGGFKGDRSGVLERMLQDDWNASMVWMIPASPQRFFTNGYEVTGLGSMEGHKVRVYNAELAKLVEILGGTPVSISFGETYTGLATGLVDGLVTSLMFADSGGMLEVCDTINLWEICQGMDGLVVSQDALAELPADVREAFLEVMYESATEPPMREVNINAVLLEDYLKLGYTIYSPSQEARDEVIEYAEKEIWSEWLKAGGSDAEEALKQAKEIMAGF